MDSRFKEIKKRIVAMMKTMVPNDPLYEEMRDIIELCDEGILHFVDDGK